MEPGYFYSIPVICWEFLWVTLFSLTIGLSQKRVHNNGDEHRLFGTDRTFTFIGILGYILIISEPDSKILFIMGAVILSLLFSIFYFFKIKQYSDYGLTSILIAMLTYSLPLVLVTQPIWMYLLSVVLILIFSESKETFLGFSNKFDRYEFVTLAKFIIIAGVILPILPKEPIVSYLIISPYKIWLAVVVISSISYISYLLRKFIFKDAGMVLTGILGGIYSSTATTIVLARKSKENEAASPQLIAGILLALTMMYARILALVYIFNVSLFPSFLIPIAILIFVSAATAISMIVYNRKKDNKEIISIDTNKNPLEFKVSLIFTFIYVAFTFINHFTIEKYGQSGLNILAAIVGVADIDPFLLNLFQGKYQIDIHSILVASMIAIVSNNLLKMVYAISLFNKKYWGSLITGFLIITLTNVFLIFFL